MSKVGLKPIACNGAPSAASPHAVSFDIDWDILPYRNRGGVLLPIIGSSYGQALENGEIELCYDPAEGSFSAWYFEHRLPIAPERYGEILRMTGRVRDMIVDPDQTGQRYLRALDLEVLDESKRDDVAVQIGVVDDLQRVEPERRLDLDCTHD